MIPEYILEKAREYKRDGYEILPCDEPTRGMRGLLAFRKTNEDTAEWPMEDTIFLEWPLFYKPLLAEESNANISEFIDFMNDPDVIVSDFPKTLQLGLIKYLPKDGKAIVKKLRISSFRYADDTMKDKLASARATKRLKTVKSFEDRFRETIKEINEI